MSLLRISADVHFLVVIDDGHEEDNTLNEKLTSFQGKVTVDHPLLGLMKRRDAETLRNQWEKTGVITVHWSRFQGRRGKLYERYNYVDWMNG